MTTGGTELLVVLAIAIMLFGPKKLPELARTMGQAMGEYHKAQREFESEIRKTTTAIDKEISTTTAAEPKPTAPKTANATPTPRTLPQKSEVKEIAKNLGINPANKTDSQILKEISLKTKKKETSKE